MKIVKSLIDLANNAVNDHVYGIRLYQKLEELSENKQILATDVDRLYTLGVYQSEKITLNS